MNKYICFPLRFYFSFNQRQRRTTPSHSNNNTLSPWKINRNDASETRWYVRRGKLLRSKRITQPTAMD